MTSFLVLLELGSNKGFILKTGFFKSMCSLLQLMILFSLFLGSYPNFLSQNSSGFVFNFLRETCLLLASNPSTLLGFNFPMLLNRIGTVCLNSAISVSLSDFYCTYIYCCFLLLCLFILASKSNLSYSLFEFTLIFWFS